MGNSVVIILSVSSVGSLGVSGVYFNNILHHSDITLN